MTRPKKPRKPGPRTRTKPGAYSHFTSYTDGRPPDNRTNASAIAETMVDSRIKPCNMSVVIQYPVEDAIYYVTNSGAERHAEGLQGLHNWPVSAQSTWQMCVAPWLYRLKNKKLATSNEADLLTAFAELDDTIAMCGKKLASSASYGGVKWGWMPLVSDIMAVNDAANNVRNSLLEGNRRTCQYNTKDSFTKKSQWFTHNWSGAVFQVRHTWEVEVKYRGSVTYENDILAFYDYMGFHPSPKLLWDLIPLSFAVDYILPIGDMLKQLTPEKGWVKSANFTGWHVVTANLSVEFKDISPGPYRSIHFSRLPTKAKYVYRNYVSGVALESKRIYATIDALKMPTLEQMLDLSFLAEAFRSTGKRLLSPHVYRKRKK